MSRNSAAEPLRVLVDMDGVLCDFEAHLLQMFRSRHPSEPYVELYDRRTFYVRDQYKELGDHLTTMVDVIVREKGFFLSMPEIEGAVDAVKSLSGMDGVEVFICTTPVADSEFCAQEKLEWIRRHMGMDWVSRVILTHDKSLINAHVLIDDKHRINGAVRKPTWDHILFSQCHNKHINSFAQSANSSSRTSGRSTAVERLHSWTDSMWMEIIDRYKKLRL